MPSPAYTSVVNLASRYLDRAKTVEVLDRALASRNVTADSVTTADLQALAVRLSTALSLYVADSAKREELKSKIAAL